MKRLTKIIGLISILIALNMPANAQVFFLLDDECRETIDPEEIDDGVYNDPFDNIPGHGGSDEEPGFVPLGSGALLLAAFGGAYLFGKKRKNDC